MEENRVMNTKLYQWLVPARGVSMNSAAPVAKRTLLTLFLSLSIVAWPMADVAAAASANTSSSQAKEVKAKSTKTVSKAKRGKSIKASKRSKAANRQQRSYRAARPHQNAAPVVGENLDLRSAAALVMDQSTGELLYAKNPDLATPIASITKLMTAMVTLDAGLRLDEEIDITSEDVDRLKFTSSRLPLGTTLTREELLHLALIASENRAAAALSRSYPGGREAFVQAMNRKAQQLSMHNTHYVDGTGLSSSNRSTAADLAKLVDLAYRNYPLIRNITTTGNYDVDVPGRKRMRHVAYMNTNALTRNKDWDIGVSKTGYINEAGHCLVMQAQISGQKVVIVLLDSFGKMSRIGDAARIKRWIENGSAERVANRPGKESV